MTSLLMLLAMPPDVQTQYYACLRAEFPDLLINLVDHHSKVDPYIGSATILMTYGPMLSDHVVRDAVNLKWIQALGTGVDNLIDLPSLRPDILHAMSRITDTMWPGVVVLPTMSTGATDGRALRAAGIPTYGVQGFFYERDDNRAHGRDERMMARSFYEGQTFLYELVKSLSAAQ